MRKSFIYSALTLMAFASTSHAGGNNPLITGTTDLYGTMPFSSLTASDMEEAVLEGIKLQNQEIDAIVNQKSIPTFENTIVALDRSGEVLNRAILALSNIESANGTQDIMDAMTRVTPVLSKHSTDIMLNEGLWNRIKQVHDLAGKDTSLSAEDRRLIDKTYDSFVISGANLQGEDRDKFRKLQAELSDLNVKFSQNVTNAMKDPERRMWLAEDQLGGIPASIKEAYRSAAADALKADNKPDDGSLYLVTIYRPSYSPFMTYSTNRDLRKRLYDLYNTTNIEGQYDNTQILKDIANIRLEIAKLMGKKNFAEYKLQNTMAKTPEAVMEFWRTLIKIIPNPCAAR